MKKIVKDGSKMDAVLSPLLIKSKSMDGKISIQKTEVTFIDILKFVFGDVCEVNNNSINLRNDTLVERYQELFCYNDEPFIMPAETNIINKIILPLKFAKISYMIGNYIGCIALCETVLEMICILKMEINDTKLKKDKAIFDLISKRKYDKMYQDERIKILLAYKIINTSESDELNKIKEIRNNYLHCLHIDDSNIVRDSQKTYKTTIRIFQSLLLKNNKESNGGFSFHDDMIKYLEKQKYIKKPRKIKKIPTK